MKRRISILMLSALIAGGCGAYKEPPTGSAPTANQPVNTFEAWAYKILDDAQAGLADTAAKIKSGELPQSLIPDYDRAAVVYNTSIALLKRYDDAYRAGGDVATVQNDIQQNLADLIALGLKLWPKKS